MTAALKRMWARLAAFAGRRDLDRDFDQELNSHLEMEIDENIERGMTPGQAERAARIRVGGLQSIKQQHRDARGLPFLEDLLQDLRFSFRLIGKDRSFSAAIIIVLALGIGINALGFTIVNAAFFRSMPFEDGQRLFVLTWNNLEGRRTNVSYPELQEWRAQNHNFENLAAFSHASMNVSDNRGFPARVSGARLTANALATLRLRPILGRDFAAGEDRKGAELVVLISESFWKTRYDSDPNVLGTSLRLNGEAATIVGVIADVAGLLEHTDIWAPLVPTEQLERRHFRALNVFGRVRAGVSRDQALGEMTVIGRRLLAEYPAISTELLGVRLETFSQRFVGGRARTMFLAMMGAVGFVLLIACANVANLLLSRSAYRAREIAVRTAMGATRWRVIRQLLIESVVLGFLGGGLGLVVAAWGVSAFDAAIQNTGMPTWVVFRIDYVVFVYVAAICMLTAVLFGLAPAWHVSNINNNDVLKEGGRAASAHQRVRWFSGAMVVTELALTIVLLVGAGLMARSFLTLYSIDLGINIDRLMTMEVTMPSDWGPDTRRAFADRLEAAVTPIPGIEAATVTNGVPPSDGGERLMEIDRPGLESGTRPVFVGTVAITPSFFDVVGVSILSGRGFHTGDGAPGAESVIVNERLAHTFFNGEDPVGRRLRFTQRNPAPSQLPDVWRTIVGVVPSIRHGSPQDAYLNAVVYIPYRQQAPATASLLIRSALPPASVVDAVRREVRAIDPDQPVLDVKTLEQMLADDRWPYRSFGATFGIFAVIALLLSAVGLYAVMAYAVAQRTQEIGVRMAVGAQRHQVFWLILKQGLAQLAVGMVLGLVAALALSRIMRGMLVDMSPADPATFAAIILVLTVVSMAACLLPARRATKVDPVVALRTD